MIIEYLKKIVFYVYYYIGLIVDYFTYKEVPTIIENNNGRIIWKHKNDEYISYVLPTLKTKDIDLTIDEMPNKYIDMVLYYKDQKVSIYKMFKKIRKIKSSICYPTYTQILRESHFDLVNNFIHTHVILLDKSLNETKIQGYELFNTSPYLN